MNKIDIWAPRWRDRVVLVADWKVGPENKVEITHTNKAGVRSFPNPFVMSGQKIRSYPETFVKGRKMRAVKLDDLLSGTTEDTGL